MTSLQSFQCVECGAALSGLVRLVATPAPYADAGWHEVKVRPLLMEPGTYAAELEEQSGPPGAVRKYFLSPGDVRGTRLVFENCGDGCVGFHPEPAGNLACVGCGTLVGSRTDECSQWQYSCLFPHAVRRWETPGTQAPSETAGPGSDHGPARWELLGDGPGDPRKDRRTYAIWQAEVIGCVARTLSESGGGLILLVGNQARPFGSITSVLLADDRVQRFDKSRHAGPPGGRRVLAEIAGREGSGEVALVSFEDVGRAERATTEAARWLAWQAGQLGLPLPATRLINVGPDGREHDRERAAQTVRQIRLCEPVWRYLARLGLPDRVLTGTRWRKPGLAAEAHHDDPLSPDLVTIDELAQSFSFGGHSLGQALWCQPKRGDAWLEELAARLWPAPPRPL